jgi:flagellar hook-length control protein FliK
MIIESATLSSLSPINSTAGVQPPPVTDGVVSSKGFSDTLVAQLDHLTNPKIEAVLPPQKLDSAGKPMPIAEITLQDLAASLGNDLPPNTTKNNIDHEAALGAVTDTLNYIAKNTTDAEKQAGTLESIKNMIATVAPVQQNTVNLAAIATPIEQNVANTAALTATVEKNTENTAMTATVKNNAENVVATAVTVEPNPENTAAIAATVEKNTENTVTIASTVEKNAESPVAMTTTVENNAKNIPVMAVQVQQDQVTMPAMTAPPTQPQTESGGTGIEQTITSAVVTPATTQIDLKQTNDKVDKKRVESKPQENNSDISGLLTTVIPPAVMPINQETAANNPVPVNPTTADTQSPVKNPSIGGDAKSNPLTQLSDNIQNPAVSPQPAQGKQELNLEGIETAGQIGKTDLNAPQLPNVDGEKAIPGIGTDINLLNRATIDNKTDVPAITKQLSHPEWNKDLGERIVWMSNRAIPAAEIKLNPPQLGPISVRVNVTDDQATVVFTAHHATTREAIEASIPKLREMMNSQQLNLAEVNVSGGSASEQKNSPAQNFTLAAGNQGQPSNGQGQNAATQDVDDIEQEIESGQAIVSQGLVNTYA